MYCPKTQLKIQQHPFFIPALQTRRLCLNSLLCHVGAVEHEGLMPPVPGSLHLQTHPACPPTSPCVPRLRTVPNAAPSPADPVPTDLGLADPSPADPGPADSSLADPSLADPSPTDPAPTQNLRLRLAAQMGLKCSAGPGSSAGCGKYQQESMKP